MNSSNGTFVNGEKVLQQNLYDGDEITIGKTSMIFNLLQEADTTHISSVNTAAERLGRLS